MDLLKLEDRTLAELYEAFKDNNDFIVKEGDKYTEATNRILKLDTLKDINELRKLRNNFVYTVSDLMSASRMLADIDKSLGKTYNVWMNMLQYVTTEIDYRLCILGAGV